MSHCPHLTKPTAAARRVLCDPSAWACKVCGSTDGLWVCVSCGHVGCGRNSHLPQLGGGHAKHHFFASSDASHSVCIDIVSKALHCYTCDDWCLDEPPWLEQLRADVSAAEEQQPEVEPEGDGTSGPPSGADGGQTGLRNLCLLYTSPSPRDRTRSRMPSSA